MLPGETSLLWLRDSAVHPRGIACLPEGITCLQIAGLRGPKPWRVCLTAWGGTTLSAWGGVLSMGEHWELPAWKISLSASERVLSTREAWELPAREISLSAGEKSAICWEAWELPAWEISLSAWERALSPMEDWELPAWEDWILRTVSCLWGPSGQGYLPVVCPGEGPRGQENLRAMPSYTSFLFIYKIVKFFPIPK